MSVASTADLAPAERSGQLACPDCDLLIEVGGGLPVGASVRCPRCDTELFRVREKQFDRTLAFTVTGLILLVLANVFPVVGLNLQGHQIQATLIGAASRIWQADMPFLALLVGATTMVIPLLELLAVFWLVYPLSQGLRPPGFVTIVRTLQVIHPWGMVEVFMLGILVSLVKLAHLAEVLPGVGIWAYGALMLVMTGIAASYDQWSLWQGWEEAQP